MPNEGAHRSRQRLHDKMPAHRITGILDAHEQELLRRFGRYPNHDIRTAAEVNEGHGINIIEDVIPRHLARLRESGSEHPVAVLDLGCGLGIFTDQVRQTFGQDVTVFGTTLLRQTSQEIRSRYAERPSYLAGRVDLDAVLDAIGQIGPAMHPNDGKWRSVHELSSAPEFDVIIDTYGELLYAGRDVYSQNVDINTFVQTLVAAIHKLHVGGELYIAQLLPPEKEFILTHREELQDELGIVIEQRAWHFTIRKVKESTSHHQS